MKKITCRIVLIAFVLFAFALSPELVFAQTPTPPSGEVITGDQIIIGNTFRLESGETLDGSLLVIGGTASISKDSVLDGDMVLIGGTITVKGEVTGDIVAIGGAVTLEDTAVVQGGVTLLGASVNRSPLAEIVGGISEQTPEIFNFDSQKIEGWKLPFTAAQKPVTRLLNTTFQALAMAVLAVIIGLLLPAQVKRVADTVIREPLITGGVGLLTVIVAPIVIVLVAITILLIPVSILILLAYMLAILFGFIAVGFEIGQRIASLFKTTFHPSISAGIGVLSLSLVTGYATLIPCIGWVVGAIVTILGLGAVIISRFGSSKYADRIVQAVIPPSSPQTPTPPDSSGL
ncbi:MAG: hypothetical protein KBF64_01790 [Anaerolineaceae bacterium]|nr:hypothetical protein [Anaerolineaceae bacterium]